ncbi:hypothetical protein J3R30DRAFT_3816089 [Lentinula aciculospora]|uniref:Uncharacterized protein n=1 Tax=Lentinula aciculospora TaxID=153920 RepID=A0A9W9ALA0_9AGAR|nr:hypothetical protein J3R30DRAFT_3816089 [Lentinula aciculospora]
MFAQISCFLSLRNELPESSNQYENLHDLQTANSRGETRDISNTTADLRTVAREMAEFVLGGDDDDGISVHCDMMDKNKNIENYTQGQEDHPTQQSPSFGDSDGILSCWKTGPKFSFFGCDLQVVQPTNWEGGSSRIPNREDDEIVSARVQQHHVQWPVGNPLIPILAPKPERSSKVRLEEVRELAKIAEKLVETRETDLLIDT